MKRIVAGAYFVALCLHSLSWIGTVIWPRYGGLELLALLVLPATPLVLLAAGAGLVQPRKPVAIVTGLVLLNLVAETFVAVSSMHGSPGSRIPSFVIALLSLALGIVGLVVVVKASRRAAAEPHEPKPSSTARE